MNIIAIIESERNIVLISDNLLYKYWNDCKILSHKEYSELLFWFNNKELLPPKIISIRCMIPHANNIINSNMFSFKVVWNFLKFLIIWYNNLAIMYEIKMMLEYRFEVKTINVIKKKMPKCRYFFS